MRLFIFILSSFLFICCHSTKTAQKEPILFLQKTACFGSCPVYHATVYQTGKVVYVGEKFTPYIGKTEMQLSKKDLDKLILEFENIQFEHYSSHYVNNKISDLSSTIIEYKGKRVTMRGFKVPQKLTDLVSKIEKTITESLK